MRTCRGPGARVPRAIQWATRVPPSLNEERALIQRLEARAVAHLGHDMENTTTDSAKPQIDLAEVRRDLDAGMSLNRAARKRGLPPSTLRGRLRKNGAARLHHHSDGAILAPNGAGVLQELERLLDEGWRRLSVVERLRRLLG